MTAVCSTGVRVVAGLAGLLVAVGLSRPVFVSKASVGAGSFEVFQVFSHLGIMAFSSVDDASAFFWAMVDDVERSDGWVAWDEFFVDRAGVVCMSKIVEDLRKAHAA